MVESKTTAKDPICGMTVDKITALHMDREGKLYYFCGDHCLQMFKATPAGAKVVEKPGTCCN